MDLPTTPADRWKLGERRQWPTERGSVERGSAETAGGGRRLSLAPGPPPARRLLERSANRKRVRESKSRRALRLGMGGRRQAA